MQTIPEKVFETKSRNQTNWTGLKKVGECF